MKELRQKLVEWEFAANDLKLAKDHEAKLRLVCVDELIGSRDVYEGSDKTTFDSFIAVLTARVNRNVDATALESIWEDLTEEEKACINYKPRLNLAKYRKLPDDSILHSVITESPGVPTLKLDWIPEE